MKKLFAATLAFAGLVSAADADTICRPTASAADATAAIQKALHDCAGKGITRLEGQALFVSGPLNLPSHTILEIAPGTTLEGSTNHDDYPEIEVFRERGRKPLLLAKNAENIIIRGGGSIDGRGESWWPLAASAATRPRLIIFDHSRHVVMENVAVKNSPSWQIVPYYSEDLVFRNMTITAPARAAHNTDGIDPFASKRILIDHVTIDTGDDNVAIKSGQPGSPGPDTPSEDIRIVDCIFLHGHGLSIGSELAGGAKNISAERIAFDGTDQGIRVKSGRDRGADIGGFSFRDITMKNVGTAIMLTEYYGAPRGMSGDNATPEPLSHLTPHFHDIVFENVKIESARVGLLIDGLPEAPIQSVSFKNVSVAADRGAIIRHASVSLDHVMVTAKEGGAFSEGPGAKLTRK